MREFYANLVRKKDKMCYVRGRWTLFDKESINKTFKLSEQKDGSKFKKLHKDPGHQNIVKLLIVGKREWNTTKKNPFDSISRGSLTEEAKVWFYFLSSVLRSSKHLSTMQKGEVVLLYAILKGYKMNMGKIIEKSIMNYYNSKYRGLIPHPSTITKL